MADVLSIGLSALLAQQRALATTSNNIANANTPGYSRQRVELAERSVQRLGNDMVGTGVTVALNRRVTDDIVLEQVRTAATSFKRADAFAELAATVDDLLGSGNAGLNPTLQSLVNAFQEVGNDPASPAARQALLAEARNVVARFASMDERLDQIGEEIHSRVGATVDRVNSLGESIAEINRQILSAGLANAPADLLDQRDRMLEELAGLVKVQTSAQRDGTMSVFIGSGQSLVLGTNAAQVATMPGSTDPAQPRIVLRGTGTNIDITQFVTGGELGGLLDFNREVLSPTRSELGRIAVGVVDTVNEAHRNGMDADGQLGGDFFAVGAPETFPASSNTGTGSVGVTISDVAGLDPTSYTLTFDGAAYTLQRTDNGAVVPLTGAGTTLSPFVAQGLSIVVSGAPAAGDQFLLRPLEQAAGTLRLVVTSTSDVAAAAPTRTRADLGNTGNGSISAGSIVNVGNPSLLATATIQFINSTTYSINGAGSFAYTPGADIDVNGTRVQITGTPAAGDEFVIEANTGGTGDNRNALAIIDRLGSGVLAGNTTLKGAAASLLASVGARTAAATSQQDAQRLVLEETQQRLESVRGVNLDEEAADMLRFEQLYQAAAQTIAVADGLFSTLLAALRG
jgi:flagellar hook-associated protein 1